jgi:L-fucose mutarotase/ribose pyranase (RbsD/FucU family)
MTVVSIIDVAVVRYNSFEKTYSRPKKSFAYAIERDNRFFTRFLVNKGVFVELSSFSAIDT